MSHEIENWMPVVGFEGDYEASDMGRIASIKKDCRTVLKPYLTKAGYLHICLSKGNIKGNHSIHRIVLSAFLGNRPDMVTCHINHIKTDNRLANLMWGTQKENIRQSVKDNRRTYLIAEKHHRTKLSVEEVFDIRQLYADGVKQSVISKKYTKVGYGTIHRICKNINWTHLL